MDGKHFKVKDMLPGENAAPMHPQCRCSVAAYSDRKEYDEWLDFLANGGTTEEYNRLKKSKVDKSKISVTLKPNIQLFAKKSKDFKTIRLPETEFAHVMSEIATNLTKEQADRKVFSKPIGDYIYTVENNGFGNYRVIKKIKIEEDL